MVASVPDETSRSISMEGKSFWIWRASWISASQVAPKERPRRAAWQTASTTAGWACPRIIGPQEPTRSR